MPIYESQEYTREYLEKQARRNVCSVCGESLMLFLDSKRKLAFLACKDWLRTKHEGIILAPQYQHSGIESLNIEARRDIMEQQFGKENTKALAKYESAVVISRDMAKEIVDTLWKGAPDQEKAKAIILCSTYNLNPLMKHIHLVKYNRWNKERTAIVGEDWSLIQGIQATRLLAHRNHNFTYIDMSPRRATPEEVETILGDQVKSDQIYAFVHIKDLDNGAEAYGLKGWSAKDRVKGEDKGNTPLHMACIRAERQALEFLYPAEMPTGIEVADERFFPDSGELPIDAEVIEAEVEPVVEALQKRDPDTIKTIAQAQKACFDDFGIQPKEFLNELNVDSIADISDSPAECYRKIAAVR